VKAGANALVAGSATFKGGREAYGPNIAAIRRAADDSIEHARRTFRYGIECDEPDRHGAVRNREPAITCGQ
jgi:hypothetical protein